MSIDKSNYLQWVFNIIFMVGLPVVGWLSLDTINQGNSITQLREKTVNTQWNADRPFVMSALTDTKKELKNLSNDINTLRIEQVERFTKQEGTLQTVIEKIEKLEKTK